MGQSGRAVDRWIDTPRESTLTPPYNAPNFIHLPQVYPEGMGSTHPSVHDFRAPWNGWRYWMAFTPFWQGNESQENPSIAVSNDKVTWVEPEGLMNPIEPRQPGTSYNSDTELVWDDENEMLWTFWRTVSGAGEHIRSKHSKDGIVWSDTQEHFIASGGDGSIDSSVSPAILKAPGGEWRMYFPGSFRTAGDLAGPWDAPRPITYTGAAQTNWHHDVIWHEGQYRMIFDSLSPGRIYPASSDDGINWRVGGVLLSPFYVWERGMYRPTFTPAGDGANYDVWYSNQGSGWQTAYTQIPIRHWREL